MHCADWFGQGDRCDEALGRFRILGGLTFHFLFWHSATSGHRAVARWTQETLLQLPRCL